MRVCSALHVLLDQTSVARMLFSFRPVSGAASFVWDMELAKVRKYDVRAFLNHIVHTLDMDEEELLLMLVLLEEVMRCLKLERLPRGCCRALVLCCSVLAIKHANDMEEVLSEDLHHILVDNGPLWRLERYVLGLLDWSVPMRSETYQVYRAALNAQFSK